MIVFCGLYGLQDMIADVYSALLEALTKPDCEDVSCYPVRASAAGAMIKLLEVIPLTDYFSMLSLYSLIIFQYFAE